MSQNARILEFLQSGRSLSALDALEKFGALRLAARMHNLRREGHDIVSETRTTHTGKRVARYRLRGAV